MVIIGVFLIWGVIVLVVYYLFDFSWEMVLLFGILILVIGFMVIVLMLWVVWFKVVVVNILCWEGIVIDFIGVLLVVVVYSFIIFSGEGDGWLYSLQIFGGVIFCGSLFGIFGGWVLGIVLCCYWLLDYLYNLVMLVVVLGVFIVLNWVMYEFGLFVVILMGMGLVNMKGVDVWQILYFKENFSVLLIFGLFIFLVVCLDINVLFGLGLVVLLVLLLIQFVVWLLNVVLLIWGLLLSWCECVLFSWIVLCGIVVVVVLVIFVICLSVEGYVQVVLLVLLIFLVIIGMVVL